jgi:Domain of unknown function DUF29
MPTKTKTAYDRDFYAWTQEQAAALRRLGAARANLAIDWENIAEEIESMGRSERSAPRTCLMHVLEHLLKLEYSPAPEPRAGWRESLIEHRLRLLDILAESPSLRPKLPSLLGDGWRMARTLAAASLEMRDGVPPGTVPTDCPYALAQVFDEAWIPASRHGLT